VTAVVWTAFGVAIGAFVLHAALALRRPIDRTYLSFAWIMASVAVFLWMQWLLYSSTSAEAVVRIKQCQVTVLNVSLAGMFVFVPAYTRLRVPRPMVSVYWTILAIVFVANLVAPYGLWFSGPPQLQAATFRGESYTTVLAPPMRELQLAYASFMISCVVVAFGFAVGMFRRGDRQRAVAFALALFVVLGHSLADVIRDNVGGTWPYVAEFGVVGWGVIMSMQLAHDFRAQTRTLGTAIAKVEDQAMRLRAMLDAVHALEQNMHVPLYTLEAGVLDLARGTTADDPQLRRLERAVLRLREVARSMPDISELRR
jgi:hypothetical protein